MEIPFIKQLALKQNMNLAEVSIYVETFVLGFSAQLQTSGKASFDPFGIFEVKKELEYIKEEDGCKILMPPRLQVSFCSSAILGMLATDEDQAVSPLYELFAERHEWESEAVTLFVAQIKSVVKSALLKDKKCTIPGFGTFEGELGGDISFDFSESFEDLINKPFSHFKPVELSCSEKDLKSAEQSITTNTKSSAASNAVSQKKEEKSVVENITPQVAESPAKPVVEDIKPSPKAPKLEKEEEQSLVETPLLSDLSEKLADYDKRILQIEKELRDKNKIISRFRWIVLLLVILIVLFIVLTYYMHPVSNDEVIDSEILTEQVEYSPENEKTFAQMEEDYLQQSAQESPLLLDSSQVVIKDTLIQKNDSLTPSIPSKDDSNDYVEHQLKSGETLRGLAQKYYNNKEEWGRIVKANSDIITDPNHVPIGTTLRIPK